MYVLVNLIVVITSQCVSILNHHVVHLKKIRPLKTGKEKEAIVPFNKERYLGTKIWFLVVLIDAGIPFLLVPVCRQSGKTCML